MSKFLVLPNPSTNFEMQKYFKNGKNYYKNI